MPARFAVIPSLLLCLAVVPEVAATEACADYCRRADGACSLAAREAKKACSSSAATGNVDPFTQRRTDAARLCDYFRGDRCAQPWAGPDCARRLQLRFDLCLDAYATNTASSYLACGEGERTALALCREELGDCLARCE